MGRLFDRTMAVRPAVVALGLVMAGCGWFGDEQTADLEELPAIKTATEVHSPTDDASPKRLALNLTVGDRFPLIKTVEQSLTQHSSTEPVTSRSKLQMMLAITVEEIREGSKRLGVKYHRVRYAHNIAGRNVEYDSANPSQPIPVEARAYDGLVNNTFSFWIGPDNQLLELVGFQGFLERCVRDIPEGQREAVLTKLIETSGDEGIANFVDDSIGLLPYNVDGEDSGSVVQVGASWPRERQVLRPIPMYLSSECTLQELTDKVAVIDIVGSVRPSTTYGPSNQKARDVRITVRGGHVQGSCTIDRESGLPLKSRIAQNVEMIVQLDDGLEFPQRKTTVTTVQAFPEQPPSSEMGESGEVRRVGHAEVRP